MDERSDDCLKSRQVANETNQIEGKDYNKMPCPIVKSATIWMVLKVATQWEDGNWHRSTSGVNLMWQPVRFMDKECPGHVFLLWNIVWTLTFSSIHCFHCQSIRCIIVIRTAGINIIHSCICWWYGNCQGRWRRKVLDQLGAEFAVQELGNLEYFLRIRVWNHREAYYWTRSYTSRICWLMQGWLISDHRWHPWKPMWISGQMMRR